MCGRKMAWRHWWQRLRPASWRQQARCWTPALRQTRQHTQQKQQQKQQQQQ
jgi:hypothetical protein